jgi:hypothetical protein
MGCAARPASPDGPLTAHAFPSPPLITGKLLVRGILVLPVDYFNQNWYQFPVRI